MHTSSDVDTNWGYIGDLEDIDFETQLLQEIEERLYFPISTIFEASKDF